MERVFTFYNRNYIVEQLNQNKMKRILLALLLVGLTQYSANAWPKYGRSNCNCACNTNKQVHKTAMHKAKNLTNRSSGQAFMTANSGKYVPYTNYAVYGRVHMSNRLVCSTKKELEPDPLAGIMSPVVTSNNVTTCEDQAYITNKPLVTPAVYKTKTTTLERNTNLNTQPCAYKSHGIRVSYCVQ